MMLERDTSAAECPDEDEGSTIISDGSTSHMYTIRGLEEDSNYIISVRVSNIAGSTVSESVSGVTG